MLEQNPAIISQKIASESRPSSKNVALFRFNLDVGMANLKRAAKDLGLSLLHNKDKNTFMKVQIAAGVDLAKVAQDDVLVISK